MYVIVSGNYDHPYYLSEIEHGFCRDWACDGFGHTIRKVERARKKENGREKGKQIVCHYWPDMKKAMRFSSRNEALALMEEYPTLRYSRIKEVKT